MAQKPNLLEINKLLEQGEQGFSAVETAVWAYYNVHGRKPVGQLEIVEGVKLGVDYLVTKLVELEGEMAQQVAQIHNLQLLALRLDGLEPVQEAPDVPHV